ncbi:synaptotagmin-2 isoform X1 [Brachypodium distachyon]|nr:synaptotagmin-2 isoform X1 [Brachypodium distachyon]|eukprot:XP_024317075.1 synaptotagmin-2 isoform X1 [Brachypodium distachyon]
MGFFSSVLGFFGFGVGITMGLVIGYYLFIYFQPTDVKHPVIRPLVELGTKSLESMLPEIPHWVKNPDFDRIDWLNKFVENMWPYLDKAICRTAKEIAKPIIAENTAKYKIDSVEFETLTLGSLPPTFQEKVQQRAAPLCFLLVIEGMKVYTTDEQELIMEPSIKWAGNPNITVVVKAFGLKATAQVIDLQVFALPRITLKPLVPSFPCFAKIMVSLMEKPHVDFGLKLLGADLMAIPGLYAFVQEIIKTQVANMYLWPKVLEVPIMDAANAQKKPVGILHVNVVRAVKLTKKDLMGKSDPYVKIKLTENKLPSKKTSVKRSNLNPEWNEEFKLVVKDPESQALELTVFDWEQVGKHDKIGMNVIPLKDIVPDETKSVTLNLLKTMDSNDPVNEKFRGQLTVDVTYNPFKEGDTDLDTSDESSTIEKAPDGTPDGGGLLVVIVHEAQDVEGKHHTNPYARIVFRGEERKTKHIKKNRDPRWEQEFEFVCEEPPTNDKMQIEVISRPPSIGIHSKENLGYVVISLGDVISNKRINEKFHLIDSKNGCIQLELQWRTS